MLLVFLARHLWRLGDGRRDPGWRRKSSHGGTAAHGTAGRAGIHSAGPKLISLLVVAGESLAKIATQLGHEPSRRDVIDALGGLIQLADHAALVHRLVPGVRVMSTREIPWSVRAAP